MRFNNRGRKTAPYDWKGKEGRVSSSFRLRRKPRRVGEDRKRKRRERSSLAYGIEWGRGGKRERSTVNKKKGRERERGGTMRVRAVSDSCFRPCWYGKRKKKKKGGEKREKRESPFNTLPVIAKGKKKELQNSRKRRKKVPVVSHITPFLKRKKKEKGGRIKEVGGWN